MAKVTLDIECNVKAGKKKNWKLDTEENLKKIRELMVSRQFKAPDFVYCIIVLGIIHYEFIKEVQIP
jgi:site-specific DNA-adenine methylase